MHVPSGCWRELAGAFAGSARAGALAEPRTRRDGAGRAAVFPASRRSGGGASGRVEQGQAGSASIGSRHPAVGCGSVTRAARPRRDRSRAPCAGFVRITTGPQLARCQPRSPANGHSPARRKHEPSRAAGARRRPREAPGVRAPDALVGVPARQLVGTRAIATAMTERRSRSPAQRKGRRARPSA